MCTQSSLRFSLTVSALLCRRIASRQTTGRVDGATELCWRGETVAAAAEDTLKPISFDRPAKKFQAPIKGKLRQTTSSVAKDTTKPALFSADQTVSAAVRLGVSITVVSGSRLRERERRRRRRWPLAASSTRVSRVASAARIKNRSAFAVVCSVKSKAL